jgi:hypothetical protein
LNVKVAIERFFSLWFQTGDDVVALLHFVVFTLLVSLRPVW